MHFSNVKLSNVKMALTAVGNQFGGTLDASNRCDFSLHKRGTVTPSSALRQSYKVSIP